jgi:hypothetical protein
LFAGTHVFISITKATGNGSINGSKYSTEMMESHELNWCERAKKRDTGNLASLESASTIFLASEKVNGVIFG